jgi:hypothetical protein
VLSYVTAFKFKVISKYLEFLIESITFLLERYGLREIEKKEEPIRILAVNLFKNDN